jgi:hypothetical protein
MIANLPVLPVNMATVDWIPLVFVDATDGYTPESAILPTQAAAFLAPAAATAWSACTVGTTNWLNVGSGHYGILPPTSDLATQGLYRLLVIASGARDFPAILDVSDHTVRRGYQRAMPEFLGIREWPEAASLPFSITPPSGNSVGGVGVCYITPTTTYHMFYTYWSGNYATGTQYIGHATSTDGETWTNDTAHNPVLSPGGGGTWDALGVWDARPIVASTSDTAIRIFYTGRDASGVYRIGSAISTDGGQTFTKHGSNPLVAGGGSASDWNYNNVEMTAIMRYSNTYYLWANTMGGTAYGTAERKTGLWTSSDLITWTPDSRNPIWQPDPWPIYQGGVLNVRGYCWWVTPIGTYDDDVWSFAVWRSANPTFYPEDRQLWRIVFTTRIPKSAWQLAGLDCVNFCSTTVYASAMPGDVVRMYYMGRSADSIWRTGMLKVTSVADAFAAPHSVVGGLVNGAVSREHGGGTYALRNLARKDVTVAADIGGTYLPSTDSLEALQEGGITNRDVLLNRVGTIGVKVDTAAIGTAQFQTGAIAGALATSAVTFIADRLLAAVATSQQGAGSVGEALVTLRQIMAGPATAHTGNNTVQYGNTDGSLRITLTTTKAAPTITRIPS